jgi:Mor family transcriptional regulator
MKWLLMLILISPGTTFAVREQSLLKCLGEEEKALHLKKDLGPTYDLNQKLISEVIQIPKVKIQDSILSSICRSKSPSWKLMEYSLIQGKALFLTVSDESLDSSINQSMINDYLDSTREIFIQVINQIQAISPSPDCLEKELPELASFFSDLKYLQEEMSLEKIFNGKIKKILKSLRRYPEAIKNCQERIRKTTKPSSTSDRKKS